MNIPFFDYKNFIDKNKDYPRIGRVKYLAEHKLSTNKVQPKKIIDYDMRDVVMASLFIAIKLDDCNFIINLR